MIRVLLADDQTLFRQGLRVLLAAAPDLEVVGEAKDGREAVDLGRRLAPDVILMDARMPDLDGVEATRRLPPPGPRVILLTTYDDDQLVREGIRAGAAGYLLKDQPAEEIVQAIRAVHRGEVLYRASSAARAFADLASGQPSPPKKTPPAGLTPRELEVLRLIGEGLTNRDIAERLVVSEATVKTHVNNLFGKLGFQDRGQAIAYAFRHGLVGL